MISSKERKRAQGREAQRRYRARMSPEERERELEKARVYRRANLERIRRQNLEYYYRNRAASLRKRLEKRYGLEEDGFERLMAQQDGRCGICGCESANSRDHRLHVDHCHATGAVRGLLCFRCNAGLGHFQDNPDLLREAIAWLD